MLRHDRCGLPRYSNRESLVESGRPKIQPVADVEEDLWVLGPVHHEQEDWQPAAQAAWALREEAHALHVSIQNQPLEVEECDFQHEHAGEEEPEILLQTRWGATAQRGRHCLPGLAEALPHHISVFSGALPPDLLVADPHEVLCPNLLPEERDALFVFVPRPHRVAL